MGLRDGLFDDELREHGYTPYADGVARHWYGDATLFRCQYCHKWFLFVTGELQKRCLKCSERRPPYEPHGDDMSGRVRSDADLELLQGRAHQKVIMASGSAITDKGLEHLKSMIGLEALTLDFTRITDAGLEHLKGCVSLKWLTARRTRIAGPGLQYIREATGLEWLELAETGIDDAAMEYLRGLVNLRRLDLSGQRRS